MSGTVDARIPLGFRPQPNVGPDVGAALQQAQQTWQLDAYRQQQQQQNALKQILSDPGSVDATGNPTPNALRQITAVSPEMGMKFRSNMLVQQEHKLRQDLLKTKTFEQQFSMTNDVSESALVAYEEGIKSGLPEPQARAKAQAVQDEGLGKLKQSGMFSEQQQSMFPTAFDPNQARSHAMSYKDWRAANEQQRRDDRADRRMTETELRADRRDDIAQQRLDAQQKQFERREQEQGWQVLTDPGNKDEQGNPVQYRYNPRLNPPQATTLTGEPYTPKGAAKVGASSQGSVISDEAAEFIADRILAGDPKATTNLGRSKENMTKVENILVKKAKAANIDAGKLTAAMATVRADSSSLNNLTKMTDAAVSFENTASKNFDLALKLAPKAIPTNWGPWLNRWIENGETALGDKDVPPYVTAMLTGANEYAKIMSGSTGAQGSTVDSRREAAQLFSPYLSKGQIDAVVKVAKQDMANRKSALHDQLDTIKTRISGGEGKPEGSTQPSQAKQAAPSDADVAYLKANPGKAALFDKRFGDGAAKRAMGQ
jgi:hypothetical protein